MGSVHAILKKYKKKSIRPWTATKPKTVVIVRTFVVPARR